jgi:hypothetical protein
VEILEPFHGRIFDPACGSGGMFVQSAHFVEEHKKNPSAEISIYGQERVAETVRLNKMNLAVHGLEGDIQKAITYYEDPHELAGKDISESLNTLKIDEDAVKDGEYSRPEEDTHDPEKDYLQSPVFSFPRIAAVPERPQARHQESDDLFHGISCSSVRIRNTSSRFDLRISMES